MAEAKKETKQAAHDHNDHDHAGHAHEHDHKQEAKEIKPKAQEKQAEPPKPKVAKKSRNVKVKATKESLRAKTLINLKISLPTFRGSFGQKKIRKIKNPKWNKWRVGRGIDKNHDQSEGLIPRGGYRTMKAIRYLHPSGYNEVTVRTLGELANVQKGNAVRIIAGIGRKKKITIVDKAIGMGIKVLNP